MTWDDMRAKFEALVSPRLGTRTDALFALATGASGRTLGMMTLGAMAAEACAQAVLRAVHAARSVTLGELHLPAASEFA